MRGAGSQASTRPVEPTLAAATRLNSPTLAPTSTNTSPGCSSSRVRSNSGSRIPYRNNRSPRLVPRSAMTLDRPSSNVTAGSRRSGIRRRARLDATLQAHARGWRRHVGSLTSPKSPMGRLVRHPPDHGQRIHGFGQHEAGILQDHVFGGPVTARLAQVTLRRRSAVMESHAAPDGDAGSPEFPLPLHDLVPVIAVDEDEFDQPSGL